eukprot:sb/3470281/
MYKDLFNHLYSPVSYLSLYPLTLPSSLTLNPLPLSPVPTVPYPCLPRPRLVMTVLPLQFKGSNAAVSLPVMLPRGDSRKNLRRTEQPTLSRMKKLGKKDVLDVPFFDRLIVVRLRDEGGVFVPYIHYSYPVPELETQPALPLFCFPDSDKITEGNTGVGSSYSFVLTDVTGERQHGYCKRVKSRDSCQPQKDPQDYNSPFLVIGVLYY